MVTAFTRLRHLGLRAFPEAYEKTAKARKTAIEGTHRHQIYQRERSRSVCLGEHRELTQGVGKSFVQAKGLGAAGGTGAAIAATDHKFDGEEIGTGAVEQADVGPQGPG